MEAQGPLREGAASVEPRLIGSALKKAPLGAWRSRGVAKGEGAWRSSLVGVAWWRGGAGLGTPPWG